jgi:hypothetical protein
MTTRKRQRRIELRVQQAIEELSDAGASPTQIHGDLEARGLAVPDVRTVQRIVRERAGDPSEEWRFNPLTATEDDRSALDALAYLVLWSEGRRQTITEAEAAAVVGLRRAAPDLPDQFTFRLARFYLSRRAKGSGTFDLDLWLALGPWRSDAARARYEVAVRGGLPRAPIDRSGPELRSAVSTNLPTAMLAALRQARPDVQVAGPPDSSGVTQESDPALVEDVAARALSRFLADLDKPKEESS